MSYTHGLIRNRVGRLCNRIIRNLALSLIAEKNELYARYIDKDIIEGELGIPLYSGEKLHKISKIIFNNEWLKIYNSEINYNLDLNHDFFQQQEIADVIYKHLRTTKVKESIMNKNPFKNRYNNNNDLFIHIRLGDLKIFNPGIEYYLTCIEKISFDNLYIGSDSLDHEIIQELKKKYPKANLVDKSPIQTIQFGSTCKNIILTNGSFSAIIGYLGFFTENIYYSTLSRPWYGGPWDLYLNKGWIPVESADTRSKSAKEQATVKYPIKVTYF